MKRVLKNRPHILSTIFSIIPLKEGNLRWNWREEKNCRVASTQMVTWLHLQAPKSELHLMSPAVNSDCARLESVEKMRVVCNMYSWCNLTYLSLVRSEFSRFFDDPSLAALRNGCGVLSIDFHFVIIIAGVTLWTLPVITNKYAKAWRIMHRETVLCTFMEIL